ncbi:MAG: trigger factor [Actinomycetota bacterium]
MQTTVENTEKHTVKLTVEIPPDEYSKELDATYKSIANQVKIPGFRKGKVPKQIIDAQIGREVVRDEFLEHAVPQYYRQAVSEQDLAPIADPEIDLEGFADDAPLVFTATVEVRPRLELTESEYTGLKVTRPSFEVAESDVDEWIDRLRERFAELEPADRPVIDGDFVTVDVKALAGDEEIDGLTRTDYLYFVGSGEFGSALDEQLLGTKPGDILKVSEEMGPGTGESFAGQTADLTVLVKDVKARKLPEADDDFAKTASEFDTIEQLRDDLLTRLGEMKEREATAALRDRVLDAMIDSIEVDIPDTLIDDETEHRVSHAGERAQRAGLTLDDLLEAQGWDEARLREDSRDHAVRAIRADLALEGVARAEKIEVTTDELGTEIASLAESYGRDSKELAKQLERTGQIVTLAGDIIRGKALDLLVERADIEPEGSEGAEGSAEAEPADGDPEHETSDDVEETT